jgi:hypothetical protein
MIEFTIDGKKEIYEEYSSYLDYIKEIAIKKYKKNE